MQTLPSGISLDNIEQRLSSYESQFWDPATPAAKSYMLERGFIDKTLKDFRIGCSLRRGDRFAGRVIFPVFSDSGKLSGFSGRDFYNNKKLKYLNSSEEEGFEKGKYLFGLNLARADIFKKNKAVIVEGFTDVMALHQVGITAAVAPMSTTFTDSHVRILSRYCSNLVFMFDQDERGQSTMRKAISKAVEYGFGISKVNLPNNMDPADYYLKYK